MDLSWNEWTNEEIAIKLPSSKKLAKTLGAKLYTTGRACGKGHKSIKLSTGNCAFCYESTKADKHKDSVTSKIKLIHKQQVNVLGIII